MGDEALNAIDENHIIKDAELILEVLGTLHGGLNQDGESIEQSLYEETVDDDRLPVDDDRLLVDILAADRVICRR